MKPLLLFASLLLAGRAAAGPDVRLGGMAQPQLKWEQQDESVQETNPRKSGFSLKRARLIAEGFIKGWSVFWEARVEAEMLPGFQLLDAYIAANGETPGYGFWRIGFGQQFTPFSRQANTFATRLQMIDFAQLNALTPQRQLGLSAMLAIPWAPYIQIWAGIFNGKGLNIVENLDENLMYVGRIAIRPIGWRAELQESAHGPDAIWIAGHVEYDDQKLGDFTQSTLRAGADGFFSWRGLSLYVEYLWGEVKYSKNAPKRPFKMQGFNAQAGYLFPIPGRLYRRFELAFRFEAVAPNQVVPITGPGDPTQARASYQVVLNYYHRGHGLKLGLHYSHNDELDDRDPAGRSAIYKNDSLILQLTNRLE